MNDTTPTRMLNVYEVNLLATCMVERAARAFHGNLAPAVNSAEEIMVQLEIIAKATSDVGKGTLDSQASSALLTLSKRIRALTLVVDATSTNCRAIEALMAEIDDRIKKASDSLANARTLYYSELVTKLTLQTHNK